MIVIENTESLEIVSDAAATTTEPCWSVGLVTASGPTFELASSETGSTTGATAVAMVAGVASKQKRIMGLSVYNRDTVNRTITIRRSVSLPIIRTTLLPNWSLQYSSEQWAVHDASGIAQSVGAPGSNGALAVIETEVDLGPTPIYEATVVVLDAGITAVSKIIATQSGKAATGRDADENECDSLVVNCIPAAGQFTLNVRALPGPVSGKYKINYQYS